MIKRLKMFIARKCRQWAQKLDPKAITPELPEHWNLPTGKTLYRERVAVRRRVDSDEPIKYAQLDATRYLAMELSKTLLKDETVEWSTESEHGEEYIVGVLWIYLGKPYE